MAQEELDKFLQVAETLKIRGLVQSNEARACKRKSPPGNHPLLSKQTSPKKPKMLMESDLIKVENGPISDPIPEEPSHLREPTPEDYEEHTVTDENYGDNITNDYRNDIDGEHDGDDELVEEGFANDKCDEGSRNNRQMKLQEDHRDSSEITIVANENSTKEDNLTDTEHIETTNDGVEEINQSNDCRKNDSNSSRPGVGGWFRLSSSEKVTLMNLIRTLDGDNILRDGKERLGAALTLRRKELWDKIVPAFNEICGLNCGLRKLQDVLHRTRSLPDSPAYAVLYGD